MTGLVPWNYGGYSAPPYALARTDSIPPSPPATSSLREWFRGLREAASEPPPGPVQSAIVGLRHNAEGAAIGGLLALIDTDLGGLDLGGRIPIDWAAAALFYALSIQDSGKADSLTSDYRAMGQSCISVAMFRTVHRWRDAKKGITRNNLQITGDPVLTAGKSKF